jgi:RHS repeat-associated protein
MRYFITLIILSWFVSHVHGQSFQPCSITITNACVNGDPTYFSASCTDRDEYIWNLDGREIGRGSTVGYTFSSGSTGSHTIQLIFKKNGIAPAIAAARPIATPGTGDISKTFNVSLPSQGPKITADQTTGCAGMNVSLSISVPRLFSFNWTSDPAGYTGTGSTLTASNIQTTTRFIATPSAGGCVTPSEIVISVTKTRSVPVLDGVATYRKAVLKGSFYIDHFWQTDINGTSTSNALTSDGFIVSNSNTYYLRAYNASVGCWASASSPLVVSVPTVPPKAAIRQVAGNGYQSVFLDNKNADYILSFADYYWVSSANGQEQDKIFAQGYRISSNGTYYLRGRDRVTGDWGTALQVNINLEKTDDHINYVHQQGFDGYGNVISESRNYFDEKGKSLQSQAKLFSSSKIVVQESLTDRYGRPAGSLLPGFLSKNSFLYHDAFVLNANAQTFDFRSFDKATPQGVGNQPGSLGEYYSSDNSLETRTAVSSFPYQRSEYYNDGTGEVKYATNVGEIYHLDPSRKTFQATAPVHNMLDEYLELRKLTIGNIASSTSLADEALETITRDENGRYAIAITDVDSRTLLTARLATAADAWLTQTNTVSASADASKLNYKPLVYFFITEPQQITIAGTASYYLEDVVNDQRVDVSSNLAIGLYRIVLSSGEITLTYIQRLKDIACQFYNDAGKLKCSISPNGYQQWKAKVNFSLVDKTTYQYNYRGWLISMAEPDAGTTEYIYQRDGKIRFSRNALQKAGNTFSYTHYDALERPVQSGEYTAKNIAWKSADMMSFVEKTYDETLSDSRWNNTKIKDWITTTYHIPVTPIPTLPANHPYQQTFVEGAVSQTQNASVKTWYSYDELGRVKWMAQYMIALQRVFIMEYQYNFLGNVLQVTYKAFDKSGKLVNQFYHHYEYDADNRLTAAYMSTNGTYKGKDGNPLEDQLLVRYEYFLHGALKRKELGKKLQGIDYTYTLQGWLKGINDTNFDNDPGRDGTNGFRKDAFGFELFYENKIVQGASNNLASSGLFNGLISSSVWHTEKVGPDDQNVNVDSRGAYTYTYDDKYQLQDASWLQPSADFNTFTANGNQNNVTGIAYDANGNILSLQRYNDQGSLIHNFNYRYNSSSTAVRNNRLEKIDQYATYGYDVLGRMIKNDRASGKDQYVNYDVTGKVTAVYSDAAKKTATVAYQYDDRGFRVRVIDYTINKEYWYIRDASGSLMAVYEAARGSTTINLVEIPLYGSGKIGTYYPADQGSVGYELTDHLGNVRAVMKRDVNVYKATFETNTEANERKIFKNYSSSVNDLYDHTDAGKTYKKAQLLNGGYSGQVGLAKSLNVKAGDELSVEVFAKYERGAKGQADLQTFSTALVTAFGLSAGMPGTEGQAFNSLQSYGNFVASGGKTDDDLSPKAFLNILVFSNDFTLVDAAYQQVDKAYAQSGTKKAAHQRLYINKSIQQDGFVYVYLSNEGTEQINVYFDDLTLAHKTAYVSQFADFGPWGDVIREQVGTAEKESRFGYQGEYAEEDKATGWNHFELREYDPVMGRWMITDPNRVGFSPYIGMGNEPVGLTDPDGGDPYGVGTLTNFTLTTGQDPVFEHFAFGGTILDATEIIAEPIETWYYMEAQQERPTRDKGAFVHPDDFYGFMQEQALNNPVEVAAIILKTKTEGEFVYYVLPWAGNTHKYSFIDLSKVGGEYAPGYSRGDVASVAHTHPRGTEPSDADKRYSDKHNVPMYTIGPKGQDFIYFKGETKPYTGM